MEDLVHPVWNIVHHHIQPVETSLTSLGNKIQEIIQRDNQTQTPVFLRGSILERSRPHPRADIDLIILHSQLNHDIDTSGLQVFQRFIDTHVLYPEDTQEMLYTRSHQISGRLIAPKEVEISAKWLYQHWSLYGVNRLPSILTSQMPLRLLELKKILRSVGLIWYLKNGNLSRDLNICIQWLRILHKDFGHQVEFHFQNLNQETQRDFDITALKSWLSTEFYNEWECFDPLSKKLM